MPYPASVGNWYCAMPFHITLAECKMFMIYFNATSSPNLYMSAQSKKQNKKEEAVIMCS
jgi:hypothetical protein